MSDNNENSPGLDLSFIPYLRIGFVDDQTKIQFKIKDKDDVYIDDSIEPSLNPSLIGPEHILDLEKTMIARVYPADLSNDGESENFPYMDFVDLDFIWRYTHIADSLSITNLDPWLILIVLSDTEIKEMEQAGLEVFSKIEGREILNVYTRLLPDPDLAWATAHIQLNGFAWNGDSDASKLNDFIKSYPERCNARLMAFRRLEPEMKYHLLLVNLHKCALIPYGLVADSTSKTEKAWVKNYAVDETDANYSTTTTFRVFSRSSFLTAQKGDFESLVKKIQPWQVDPTQIGTTVIDSSVLDSEGGMPITIFFEGEGALAAPGFCNKNRKSYSEVFGDTLLDPNTTDLLFSMNESLKYKKEVINPESLPVPIFEEQDGEGDDPSNDPLVTYPVYGRYFRHIEQVELPHALDPDTGDVIIDLDTNKPILGNEWPSLIPWVHELNLDYRNRFAAGYGTTVVQNNQDKYLEDCWSQVGDLNLANEKLRLTKIGFGVSKNLYNKNLSISSNRISPEHMVFLSSPFHSHFAIDHEDQRVSLKSRLKTSGLSPGLFSPVLRRIANRNVSSRTLYNQYECWAPWKKAEYVHSSLRHYSQFTDDCTPLVEFLQQHQLKITLVIEEDRSTSDNFFLVGTLTDQGGMGINGVTVKLFRVDTFTPPPEPIDVTSGGPRLSDDDTIEPDPSDVDTPEPDRIEIEHDRIVINGDGVFRISLSPVILSTEGFVRIYLEFSDFSQADRGRSFSDDDSLLLLNTKGCLEIHCTNDALRIFNRLPKRKEQEKDRLFLTDFSNCLTELGLELPSAISSMVLDPTPPPKPEIILVSSVNFTNDVFPKFTPHNLRMVLKNKLSQVIQFNDPLQTFDEKFDPIRVTPRIDDPLCVPLKQISLETILPGVGKLENNIVFLMEENRRFIESFICPANQELGLELLFNEFYTDQRGTIFRYFWESTTFEAVLDTITEKIDYILPSDIDDIHTWKEKIGSNKTKNMSGGPLNPPRTANLVLVLKGDVIRRYPDIIFYCLKCKKLLDKSTVNDFTESGEILEIIDPIFQTQLGADILCVGFPIALTDLRNSDDEYYFVLQQPLDLPVFGADAVDPESSDGGCDTLESSQLKYELSWSHLIKSGCLASNNYIDNFCPACFSFNQTSDPTSASIAAVTYQLPMRVVYHASSLIDLKH